MSRVITQVEKNVYRAMVERRPFSVRRKPLGDPQATNTDTVADGVYTLYTTPLAYIGADEELVLVDWTTLDGYYQSLLTRHRLNAFKLLADTDSRAVYTLPLREFKYGLETRNLTAASPPR